MAISLADPARSERATWSRQAALHNLALQLVKGAACSFESLGQARKLLVASRSLLGKGLDVRKLESLYVEGLLVYRIGWNRHGERLLERARQGLRKLGRIEEFAVATLDLALMLTEDGEAEPRRARARRARPGAARRARGVAGGGAFRAAESRARRARRGAALSCRRRSRRRRRAAPALSDNVSARSRVDQRFPRRRSGGVGTVHFGRRIE